MSTVTKLRSGASIPTVGLGVYRANSGEETYEAVKSALSLGYRHIDTAQIYRNEADVGRAVIDSGVPREDVWITSKVWLDRWGYDSTLASVKESLKRLQTSYIDLMILHAPGDPDTRAETYMALEDAKAQGLIKSVGVSNFGIHHLKKLLTTARKPPDVNQIELHPFLQWRDLVEYCQEQGIAIEAYSPLSKARFLDEGVINEIAEALQVTPAQVMVRWSVQKGYIPLPKSVHPERQATNIDVFRFSLTDEQMTALDDLDAHLVTGWNPIENDPV